MSSRPSSMPTPEPGAYFDERAKRYDQAYDSPVGYPLRSRMEAVLRLVGDGCGEALDVGMGPGRLASELVQHGWTVNGVDASAQMVAAAQRRMPETPERLVQGEIESLPFADGSFDAVIATGVLEYSDLEGALLEIARVLRPGGLAVVSYPNPGNLYGFWKTRIWYPFVRAAKHIARQPPLTFPRGAQAVPPHRFRERLRAVGLQPRHIEYTSYLVVPAPLDEILPRLTETLGRRLERTGSAFGRRLAGQVVYAARREK